jgi:hypothetical protein
VIRPIKAVLCTTCVCCMSSSGHTLTSTAILLVGPRNVYLCTMGERDICMLCKWIFLVWKTYKLHVYLIVYISEIYKLRSCIYIFIDACAGPLHYLRLAQQSRWKELEMQVKQQRKSKEFRMQKSKGEKLEKRRPEKCMLEPDQNPFQSTPDRIMHVVPLFLALCRSQARSHVHTIYTH